MRVAVVGGGVNGLCVAWQCALNGQQVTLFERGRLLGETSGHSTKLLHGGLRYLKQLNFSLVFDVAQQAAAVALVELPAQQLAEDGAGGRSHFSARRRPRAAAVRGRGSARRTRL